MRSSLLLACLLAVVPFVSASPTRPELARRATPTFVETVPVPEDNRTYGFVDCIPDSETNRLLGHEVTPQGAFTVESCLFACSHSGFVVAGVENAVSCFCDDGLDGNFLGDINKDNCKEPCPGNSAEACGGFNLLLFYDSR